MEYKCPKCNAQLNISKSRFETEIGSVDIYSALDMVCINPKCPNFCGSDLSNPAIVVEIVRSKIN